jgi:4-alpha-glucanotransferase
LIDWANAAPDRMRDLRLVYDRLDEAQGRAFDSWRQARGERLEAQARFDALHAYFHARDRASGWPDWPEDYRDPASEAVDHFAAEHRDAVSSIEDIVAADHLTFAPAELGRLLDHLHQHGPPTEPTDISV